MTYLFEEASLRLSGRTAIRRHSMSAPVRRMLEADVLDFENDRIIDIGCGHGRDRIALGIEGWDPVWRPELPEEEDFDVGLMIYVLNTLPPGEREKAVQFAFDTFHLRELWAVVRTDKIPVESKAQYVVILEPHTFSGFLTKTKPKLSRGASWATYHISRI